MRTWILGIAGLLALAATPAPQGLDGPVAMVVKVDGDVMVTLASRSPAPATVGTGVEAGDRIIPSSGSSAVLVYRTGATRTVSQEETISEPESPEERDLFNRTVQVLAQAAGTDARARPNRQGMIRPLPGQPGLISPVNDLMVMGQRPTFAWFSTPGATGYRIQVRVPGETPVRLEVGADTVWTWPDAEPPLRRGVTYHWTVSPVGSGRIAPEGRFQVLDSQAGEELETELDLLRELGLDPDGDGLFLTAILFREWGLPYDAVEALARLEARGDPVSAPVLYLQGELLDAMGRLEEAGRVFTLADGMATP